MNGSSIVWINKDKQGEEIGKVCPQTMINVASPDKDTTSRNEFI